MSQDINGNYSGILFGKDRQGHTTPDAEASEILRPYLPVSYAAPWLPGLRVDDGHPIHGQVVISGHMAVGLDKSGGLVPAGMRCGTSTLNKASGGYYAIKYSQTDVDFKTISPVDGSLVTSGQVVVLAAASDAANGDTITFPDGSTYTVTSGDITFAQSCNLFDGNVAKVVGIAPRNIWQYLGGTTVASNTNGIKYTLNGMVPVSFRFHNYMHEMGAAVQTQFYLRLPWIGNTPNDLTSVATSLSITGYSQTNYGRSFVHFTGSKGSTALHLGCLVKASEVLGDAGHFAPFVTGTDTVDKAIGRVLAIQEMYPIKDYVNRVRTLWDNSRLGGPLKDPNPASIMMGGSQTGGIGYQLNLGTDGLFKLCLDQAKTPDAKMYTYVYILIKLA